MKPAVLRAVERVRNGETALAAARAEGVDNSGVGRACKRLGVPMRGRGRPRTFTVSPSGDVRSVYCALPSCPRPRVRGDYCARCAPLMETAP